MFENFDLMEMIAPTPTPIEKLFQFIEEQKQTLAADMLDDIKLDLNLATRNEGGNTALTLSAAYGMDLVVPRILSRRPESINEISASQGSTALHLAVSRSHVEVVKILLKHGADLTLVDSNGKTVLDVCRDLTTKQIIQDALRPPPPKQVVKEGEYTHGDGKVEIVRIVKEHSDAEGGGFTIFVPSLDRERQTVSERLKIITAPSESSEKQASSLSEQTNKTPSS